MISKGHFTILFNPSTIFGDGLVLLNAIIWAWFTLKGKVVLEKYSPFTAMAYIHIFGTILLLPFAVLPSPFVEITLIEQLPSISIKTISVTAYLAVFCSVYGYFIWYLGISKIGAVKTAIYSYFNPIMATIAGMLIFNEKLTMYVVIGGLLVILGVYITNQKGSPLLPRNNYVPNNPKERLES